MQKRFISILFAALLLPIAVLNAQAPQPDPKDPQYQAKGDQKRTYSFPGTGESIPYHLYVPMKWNKNTRLPLVIVTHGAGQPSDAPFVRGDGALAKFAEERGYIVAAITGYKASATAVDGGYNNPFKMVQVVRQPRGGGAPGAAPGAGGGRGAGRGAGSGAGAGGGGQRAPQAPATAEDKLRAEQDILYVTDLVAKEYNTDPNRTYLMGNSSGGGAVWYMAEKYPERWTAISPSAGPLTPTEFPYEKMKTVPVLAVHGDADTTMDYEASKQMVELAKKAGLDATFLGVPGGTHTEAWTKVLPETFDFFDKYKTKKK
ncbi:MAG TPA: prolyl oligopeptidase family serine peptidase [Terriglobia bacterium]|nr:prolyl oligopeptidase family serine peptidase [Terriglobia bacterium]